MVLVNSLASGLPTLDDKVSLTKAIMYDWMELPRLPCSDDQLAFGLYFSRQREAVDCYREDVPQGQTITNSRRGIDELLIRTPQINGYLDVVHDFLMSPESTPFLIIGPSGTGKTLLVQEAVATSAGCHLITVNCSAQMSAAHIRYVLRENMVTVSGARGKEYRPKSSGKTVLWLKNLNLVRVDCYGTSDVVELVLEIVYRSGFYATATDWISVAGVQICGSLTIDPALEFNKLSPRLINLCRYLIVGHPRREEDLQMIMTRQLECLSFVNWKIRPESIAQIVVGVFNQLKERLRPERSGSPPQYELSPKLISRTIKYLQRYQEDNLAEAVAYELTQIFRNRLSTADDVKAFDEILSKSCLPTTGNGDILSFLSTFAFMPGRSGGAQQLYSREELKSVLIPRHIDVCNTEDIYIEVPLTETLLDNILAIARVVCQPKSHLVLCGAVGGGRREAVHIVADLMQFKLHTIQATRSQYEKSDFYNDLKAAMQSAALEDVTTVLLVDFTWLNHCPEIMGPVEAVLEGSDIPELFGDELESVAAPLKQAAQNDNNGESLGSFFMKRGLMSTGKKGTGICN